MARSKKQDYRHSGKDAVQRPDIGLESHVMKRDNAKKKDRKYPKRPSLAGEAARARTPASRSNSRGTRTPTATSPNS